MGTRDRDSDVLAAGLRAAKTKLGARVVFGGLVEGDTLTISELLGARTRGLQGLQVRSGQGVGGRAVFERRPIGVVDYGRARSITHEHDGPVLSEGLRSVMAVPVLAFEKVRAMVYVGSHTSERLGETSARALTPFIRGLEREIRIRDEVDRRVAAVETTPSVPTTQELLALREVQAELREIAAGVDDPELVARLRALGARLTPTKAEPLLTPRELDVLALVALGCGNAEVATRRGRGV